MDKVAMAADFVQTDEILPSPSAEQYFAPDEVDQPAAPVPDWKVDLDHVSIADAYSIELLIYISSTGSIDGYKIHRTTAGVEWIEMLLAPIFETEVSPAMRDGKPVASFLNVQFVIDSGF